VKFLDKHDGERLEGGFENGQLLAIARPFFEFSLAGLIAERLYYSNTPSRIYHANSARTMTTTGRRRRRAARLSTFARNQ